MSGSSPTGNTDPASDLHRYLQESREGVLASLDSLSEYDIRRPLTPTGTNLLGLVKHLAGIEFGYLGDSVGRPAAIRLPWVADGSIWDSADIVREMIDGRAGGDRDEVGDAVWWARHIERVRRAADAHRRAGGS